MGQTIRSTAIHEAGHAVISRVLNVSCGQVSIEADSNSAGYSMIGQPAETYDAWDLSGRNRSERTAYHAHAISLMAGAEAEAECIGCCAVGDSHDREEIALLMLAAEGEVDCVPLEMRLRRATRTLVRRHRDRIERLAEALLDAGTIEDDMAIRAIAGLPDARPVADAWA